MCKLHDRKKIINRNMNGKHIKYSVDNDGIAFVTWDVADSPVNIMNEHDGGVFSTIKIAIDEMP
jgi:3-hydroxyacyl-CoA dehydrogenase/enoyl-CoA hydratase/3-hydroxybutyryl-CoA epimerase